MAEPITFPETNFNWTGPTPDIADLPAYYDPDRGETVSCWELTEAELAEVASTGKVWLHVFGVHPPVIVSGERPFTDAATSS